MGADLSIHVFGEGELTEENFAAFFSNTMGSKWFHPRGCGESTDRLRKLEAAIMHSESVWVGEVSWLKAGLSGDDKTFIPDCVQRVAEIVGEEWPVVDDEFIAKISEAMSLPNKTSYEVSSVEKVLAFLEKHKGKRAFAVSW